MAYKIIRRFVPLAFLATALCGLVYLAVQQSLREGANDPQIQMAEDAAEAIVAGAPIASVVPSSTPIAIAASLSPYMVIYDSKGVPVAGNGYLPYPGNCPSTVVNKLDMPCLPQGVFSSPNTITANVDEDRITWEPAPGIRQAIVVAPATGAYLTGWSGYVMVGRSLREVEIRESKVGFEAGIVWIFTIVGLLILEIIFALIESRWMKR